MHLSPFPAAAALVLLVLFAACAPARAPEPAPEVGALLPPIPAERGALTLDLVYPPAGATLGVRDSTFVFGNTGTGAATLTINGAPVEVQPNGAFLAFLPIPEDGRYTLVARSADGAEERLEREVKVPARPVPAAQPGRLFIVPGSHMPRGAFTLEQGEPLQVSVRGTPGATARLRLPDGTTVPLTERPAVDRATGFMLEQQTTAGEVAEYVGTVPARIPVAAEDPDARRPALAPVPAGTRGAVVELIRGADTVRAPLPLSLGVLPAGTERVAVATPDRLDRTLVGTAVAGGGTPYHWFFPEGTQLRVTGERAGELRVRLTPELSVWVDADDVTLLPAGTPPPVGWVGSVRATAEPEWVDIRLSTSERLPFRVDPEPDGLTLTVYNAETRTNWLQYGATDPFIERMEWEQPGDETYRLHVELSRPFWGYRAFYDQGGNLILRVRRPPEIDPAQPLRGLRIAVDAGHPPGGAVGPTGYTEAEANLAIAKQLIPMLEARGAEVVEIRPTPEAVGLAERPVAATESGAHLLVSVHNNAFPDGVNPWENNGTSVFYNQPQSLELARALQHELLAEFRLRDLGIARADLALVRPTWMPSALTETMFLMIPQQEAALKDPRVQQRTAEAHVRGIERFLREVGNRE